MSAILYPQGMNSYNNRKTHNLNLNTNPVLPTSYNSWKGSGAFSNPIGISSTHIRPLTNNDAGNVFPTGFGLPRPIKHYRRGRVIPVPKSVFTIDSTNPGKLKETSLIEYNTNRAVKSSKGSSINGGIGPIGALIGTPGNFIVKDKSDTNINTINNECSNCQGVGLISSWYPISNLTEKPEEVVTSKTFCCNEERKAIKRTLPASTIVKKNYYQTSKMYLYNRCKTFKQREFNFITNSQDPVTDKTVKPGAPLSEGNLYVAQCNPQNGYCMEECGRVYYKPNNPQYAKQGAVSSSTRNLKLNVTTIEKNALNQNQLQYQSLAYDLQRGQDPNIPFINKMKTPTCNPATYTGNPFFFQGQHQNPKICSQYTQH
jgi:hypothetical protein